MDLDKIHKISEIVAAFALVASLLFVGTQVGQNTRALGLNATNVINHDWATYSRDVPLNAEFRKIWFKGFGPGRKDFAALAPDELMAMQMWLVGVFKQTEVAHMHWRDRVLDERIWISQEKNFITLLKLPQVRATWTELLFDNHNDEFVVYVETTIAAIAQTEAATQ
jgi:hypothetical protein